MAEKKKSINRHQKFVADDCIRFAIVRRIEEAQDLVALWGMMLWRQNDHFVKYSNVHHVLGLPRCAWRWRILCNHQRQTFNDDLSISFFLPSRTFFKFFVQVRSAGSVSNACIGPIYPARGVTKVDKPRTSVVLFFYAEFNGANRFCLSLSVLKLFLVERESDMWENCSPGDTDHNDTSLAFIRCLVVKLQHRRFTIWSLMDTLVKSRESDM